MDITQLATAKQTLNKRQLIAINRRVKSPKWSLPCVASVSVWFGAKKDRGTGFSVLAAREMKQEPKNESRGRERGRKVSFLSSPPPPCSFTCAIFRAFFDSRSSFFAPKRPYGKACYAVKRLSITKIKKPKRNNVAKKTGSKWNPGRIKSLKNRLWGDLKISSAFFNTHLYAS